MDKERFESTAHEFGLYQIDKLNYIDEYPLATEWLQKFEPSTLETEELIKELDRMF